MKNFSAILLLCACTSITGIIHADDLSITGNLTVGGTADIEGNVLTIGSWAGNTGQPGLLLQYGETNGASTITFDASRNSNLWLWRHNTSNGLIPGMKLDDVHKLSLFGSDGSTAGVVLDPGGLSTLSGSLKLGGTVGTANELSAYAVGYNVNSPNDGLIRVLPRVASGGGSTITLDGQRVLTAADAATFVSRSAGVVDGSLSVGGTMSVAGRSLTMMGGSVGSGGNGYGAPWGVAIGPDAYANPFGGLALGVSTRAYGPFSVAMGPAAAAGGYGSIAAGVTVVAAPDFSFAAGYLTSTASPGQFVVGVNNLIDPSPITNTMALTNAAFVVGNGSYGVSGLQPNPSKSNAFLVRFNGDTEASGNLLVKKGATIQQNITVTGSASAASGTYTGNVQVGGKVTATQGARFDNTVRIAPKGGLSMGSYTYDPDAQSGL